MEYPSIKMFGGEPFLEAAFFEYTKLAYEINLNEQFNLVIKNIKENCAESRQANDLNSEVKSGNEQGEIPNLEQILPITPRNDNVFNIDNSLENNNNDKVPKLFQPLRKKSSRGQNELNNNA